MTEVDVRRVSTSRGPVEYVESGQGPAVLCLHGAMGGWDQSSILGRTIGPAGYRYIGLSRPGYLGTPMEAGRSAEDQADLFAEVLERLGIRKAVVFAVSGGGPSAIYFAQRHRAMCRALVLASTCGGPVKQEIPWSFHVMMVMARCGPLVRMMQRKTAQNLRQSLARSVTDAAMLERMLGNSEAMALFEELTVGMFDGMGRRIAGTKNDIRVSATTRYPLHEIAVPALVVHGTKDPLLPFAEHGKRLAEEIPGAELCVAEGGEHVAIFTHRDEVRARVAGFLEGLDARV